MTRGRFSTPQQAPMFYGVVFDREDDDTFGVILRVRAGDRLHGVRIAFPREVHTPDDTRVVLIEMVREARARLGVAS